VAVAVGADEGWLLDCGEPVGREGAVVAGAVGGTVAIGFAAVLGVAGGTAWLPGGDGDSVAAVGTGVGVLWVSARNRLIASWVVTGFAS
jgi:hypothetical protein